MEDGQPHPARPTPAGRHDAADAEWLVMLDPRWQPDDGADHHHIPAEVVVGAWAVAADGEVGLFEANLLYQPDGPDAPTDPLDAALQLAASGRLDPESLLAVVRATLVDLAVDDAGAPVVGRSPDEVDCVLVATADPHRTRVPCANWRPVDLAELLALIPSDVDVLFNPGGPASVRLLASALADGAARG